MSFFDYKYSIHITQQDYPFYALIMAAMRQADSDNLEMLQQCWPNVWNELQARYYAPAGWLETDPMTMEQCADFRIIRNSPH